MTQAAQGSTAAPPAAPAGTVEFLRYLAVSLAALGLDFACLFALVEAGVHYLAANAVAFALGAALAYFGSVVWAFSRRRVADRGLEFALFVGVGVLGLAINELALWACVSAAAPLAAAKLAAAGASFLFNYGVRRSLLFR